MFCFTSFLFRAVLPMGAATDSTHMPEFAWLHAANITPSVAWTAVPCDWTMLIGVPSLGPSLEEGIGHKWTCLCPPMFGRFYMLLTADIPYLT